MEEQQPLPRKSKRTFEEWLLAVKRIIQKHTDKEIFEIQIDESKAKEYYDRALMPDVFVKEVYNN